MVAGLLGTRLGMGFKDTAGGYAHVDSGIMGGPG